MSLLHTISSLVHSNGVKLVPASRDAWPEYTVQRVQDVDVAGVSLVGMAAEVGTPCVRNAAAVVPGTDGVPSSHRFASVVVTRVIAVVPAAPQRLAQVWVDAELHTCQVVPGAVRVIGRTSGVRVRTAQLRPDTTSALGPTVEVLPADIREGDLLAVPCVGATSLYDIRRHARHSERLSDDRLERRWHEGSS